MHTPPPQTDPPRLDQALDQALQTGITHHRAGRLEYAGQLYRAILSAHPQHADANHLIGVLHMQEGQPEAALEYFTNACGLAPEAAQHWISVAACLLSLQRSREAIEVLETALQAGLEDPQAQTLLRQARASLAATAAREAHPEAPTVARPDIPVARPESSDLDRLRALVTKSVQQARMRRRYRQSTNLSPSLQQPLDADDWKGLEVAAWQALTHDPLHGKAWDLLGMAHLQLDRNAAALIALSRASTLMSKDAAVWDHLGIARRQAAQYEAAEQSFKRSLVLEPLRPETWVNLGNLQLDQAQAEKAIISFQRALVLKPDFFEAHNNLGNALRDTGQFAAASASFHDALRIRPDLAEAHSNLGNTQKDLGLFDAAIASYQQALRLKPNLAEAHSGLARVLIDRGQTEAAINIYRRALEIKPDFTEAHSNLLQSMYSIDYKPSSHCLDEARRYGQQASKKVVMRYQSWPNLSRPEPLRIGLVSGDLRNHPVGYFLEGLLSEIDTTRLELFAYFCSNREDELSARLRPYFSAWTPLQGLSDEQAARQIHSDGMHVLLDLSGHTGRENRLPLFAWKPAPVQASWLGYFATTGVAEIDYLLGDPHVTPQDEEGHFTETIWRLPESYLCFTPPGVAQDPGPLPALAEGHVTFGCFNNLNKMNEAVVALWARVLQAIPDSRLFLKTKQLGDPLACDGTRQRFATRGISADRLLLEGSSPRAELLAAYQRVDIALDPFPYPGGTTSVEGLWMGVPVITRQGNRFLSHIGESIARNAGLADWIGIDDDDYVARAVAQTKDLRQLAKLRAGLRRQVLASPLFDAPRFARHFESALWGMWQARGTPA